MSFNTSFFPNSGRSDKWGYSSYQQTPRVKGCYPRDDRSRGFSDTTADKLKDLSFFSKERALVHKERMLYLEKEAQNLKLPQNREIEEIQILEKLIRAKNVSEVEKKISEIRENGNRVAITVYHLAMDLFVDQNEMQKAEFILDMIKEDDIGPTTSTYNILIKGYVNLKNIEDAAEVYDSMIQEKIQPNDFTLYLLIKGFKEVGDSKGIYKLFATVEERMLEKRRKEKERESI